MSLATS